MKTYLIADTHLNHEKIKTWCDRPDDFTERLDKNVCQIVKPGDLLIHLGDVGIGKTDSFMPTVQKWKALGMRLVLVRGNHDTKSPQFYMDNGFDFCCDAFVYRGIWLTHKPWHGALPTGTHLNVHGHLHNVWHGFLSNDPEKEKDEFTVATQLGHLLNPWQRLFAAEYTNYSPVEFDKFIQKPDKYQARGPNQETKEKMKKGRTVIVESAEHYKELTGKDYPDGAPRPEFVNFAELDTKELTKFSERCSVTSEEDYGFV
jgi:calcineurin-like phosphoesterase family protein